MTKQEVEENFKKLSNPATELEQQVRLEGFKQGMGDLGAEYVSHNKHNIYFKLKEGHQFTDDVRIKKAKNTAMAFTGLVLRFNE